MNQSTISIEALNKLHHIQILQEASSSQADGYLQVSRGSLSYLICFNQGKLIYATNSVDPFERLERHLRRLSIEIQTLTNEVRNQARLNFEIETPNASLQNNDYKAICWLVQQYHLTRADAARLIEELMEEVFESYLLLKEIDHQEFTTTVDLLPAFRILDCQDFLKKCYTKLQGWQALSAHISSAYQRLYFFSNTYAKKNLSEEQQQKFGSILRGFNFHQLAVILNQNELVLAQKLYPLIVEGAILLREPQPPFDQLPKFSDFSVTSTQKLTENLVHEINPDVTLTSFSDSTLDQKNYKIACIDDSPTILNEMNRFLEDNSNLSVFTISDSTKALMTVIRIHPDLILLDVGMPSIDGYQLCSMLRKHSLFKTTPIVMVTGNKGIIDRAKAKFAGATDYMTKPFTQADLLKMVFRYLT